jgi:hypothetical protein
VKRVRAPSQQRPQRSGAHLQQWFRAEASHFLVFDRWHR